MRSFSGLDIPPDADFDDAYGDASDKEANRGVMCGVSHLSLLLLKMDTCRHPHCTRNAQAAWSWVCQLDRRLQTCSI